MNESKNERKAYKNEMPLVDDGWWASVLADEQKYTPQRPKPSAAVPIEAANVEAVTEEKPEPIDWDRIRHLYKNDRILEMQVAGHNKGGLLVEGAGVSGFVPFSHLIELTGKEAVEDRDGCVEGYIGKMLKVKVIECTPESERIIFSERAALAEPGKRAELFETLSKGARVTGVVTNITDFGVFIDLGGVEGLVHISELSWGRVSHPNLLVKIGQQIDVQVMEISTERCRVALSVKRLMPNPWVRAADEFSQGSLVSGTITSIMSFGAFASLPAGVEGLIHATEMPLAAGQSPRDILSVGEAVKLRVLHIEPERQRLGFSMKLDTE